MNLEKNSSQELTATERIALCPGKDMTVDINTAALISLLLACRLPEAKAFREAVVSKALMRPGKSGSPPEWTETDKQLADPGYPLRVLMQIIEAREKRIIDRES